MKPNETPAAAAQKPNIVFILVDNVGWGTFGAYGGTIPTDLTQGWIFAPNFRIIAGYERSLKQYPNIKVKEDFQGYKT